MQNSADQLTMSPLNRAAHCATALRSRAPCSVCPRARRRGAVGMAGVGKMMRAPDVHHGQDRLLTPTKHAA